MESNLPLRASNMDPWQPGTCKRLPLLLVEPPAEAESKSVLVSAYHLDQAPT